MRTAFQQFSRGFRSLINPKQLIYSGSLLAAPAVITTSSPSFVAEEERLSQEVLDEVLDTVKSTYNDPIIALNYSEMRDPDAPNMQFIDKYIDKMKSMIDHESKSLLLMDIGCGTGATMSKTIDCIFKQNMDNIKQCDIFGIDIAETMLAVADQHLDFALNQKRRNKNENMDINYSLLQGDMRDLLNIINHETNKDNQGLFDGICSYYAIIHVPRQDHQTIFQQCWQLLKDNGLLCVCIGAMDLSLDFDTWDSKPMYWSHFDQQTSKSLVEYCGFKIIESKFIPDTTADDENCGHLFVLAQKINP